MLFFKIFLQENKEALPLYKKIHRSDFLVGNYPNSYAIPYSPEKFSKWIDENTIYSLFIHYSIKQALINNRKFMHILNLSENLNMCLSDCQFYNIDLDLVLEGEPLGNEVIIHSLKNKHYRLLKISFRLDNRYLISIKRNGVIEIDEQILITNNQSIRKLIDIINLGHGVST
ncbi:hypothetical protein [Enterococcus faecium]|uniref:hypothetical protein n=1 Tax=Enterococcus TaxID=1350 RepID=UPI000A34308C|nr:hypothetical protein [Enterococcus faecium]OTN78263.1 hypothetical protein A5826_002115 [Enterococcus faecium]